MPLTQLALRYKVALGDYYNANRITIFNARRSKHCTQYLGCLSRITRYVKRKACITKLNTLNIDQGVRVNR